MRKPANYRKQRTFQAGAWRLHLMGKYEGKYGYSPTFGHARTDGTGSAGSGHASSSGSGHASSINRRHRIRRPDGIGRDYRRVTLAGRLRHSLRQRHHTSPDTNRHHGERVGDAARDRPRHRHR